MDTTWFNGDQSMEGAKEDSATPRVSGCSTASQGSKRDWRDIRRAILDRVAIHPCTAAHFTDLFASTSAAYRSVARLRKRGKIRPVGTVMLKDSGRPLVVYCNTWQPKDLRHEVLLTDFLLLYPQAIVRRGYAVDETIRPDAELTFGSRRLLVELDTGEMTHRQVQQRWSVYRGVEDLLLVVTCSPTRLENLRRTCEAVANIALFTTLDQAKPSPFGEIWIDHFGNKAALPSG